MQYSRFSIIKFSYETVYFSTIKILARKTFVGNGRRTNPIRPPIFGGGRVLNNFYFMQPFDLRPFLLEIFNCKFWKGLVKLSSLQPGINKHTDRETHREDIHLLYMLPTYVCVIPTFYLNGIS